MDKDEAKQKGEDLLESVRGTRLNQDSWWALAMAYASGRQWGWIARRGAGQALQRLKEVIDPGRNDVRVTYDFIREMVRRTTAGLKPSKLPADVKTKADERSLSNKHVYDAILDAGLIDADALYQYRCNQRPRCVLGTSYIRRYITNSGAPYILPERYQPEKKSAPRLRLRNLKEKWAVALPFEILRDPAADTPSIGDNETIAAHEKPWTVSRIARNYDVKIQTETTMGSLLHFERQLSQIAARPIRTSAQNSQAKAVILYDFFLQDDEEPTEWPWELLAYFDPAKGGESGNRLTVIQFGRSPFHGLPLHAYHYDTDVKAQSGTGVPLLLKPLQDIGNIAASTAARVMIDHAGPKWRYLTDSVDNPDIAFSNRTDTPIAWHPPAGQSQPFMAPDRIAAPGANPVANDMLSGVVSRARESVNFAAIQFGEMVKRGQSGEAYKMVGEQAEAVMDDLRQDDIIETQKLLLGTLVDTCRLLRLNPKQAMELVGGELPRDQIAAALRDHPLRHVKSVVLLGDPLRNRSPGLIRDDYMKMVQAQMKPAEEAAYEMLVQGGIVTNTRVANARRKQLYEITQILAGETVEPTVPEDHATAMRVITEFVSDVKVERLTDAQLRGLEEHWAMHRQIAQQLALWDQQGAMEQQAAPAAQPGMGSAPASPEPTGMPAGTMGPAVNVA